MLYLKTLSEHNLFIYLLIYLFIYLSFCFYFDSVIYLFVVFFSNYYQLFCTVKKVIPAFPVSEIVQSLQNDTSKLSRFEVNILPWLMP